MTCSCKILFYIVLALSISIIGLVSFAVLHTRKLKLYRGCLFSNAVKIMLFISDVEFYVPIKLCKTAGSIHLFKFTGMLKPKNIKLKRNYIWNVIEIDWEEVNMTFNSNKINLPKSVTIMFRDKFKNQTNDGERTTTLSYHVKTRLQFGSHWFPMVLQLKLYKTSIDILIDHGL